MFSAQYTSTEVQPAADHALPYIPRAEGRLGKPNSLLYYLSQPSRSTKLVKRAKNIINNEPDVLKFTFNQTSTIIGDLVIITGGPDSTHLFILNSTSLIVNEQNTNLPVSGHGAVPIRGSKILITFGIQTMTPQKIFAPPIQQFNVNKTDNISFPTYEGEIPQLRYYHTTTKTDDDKIYIFGGISKKDVILGDIFYLDLNSNSWNFIEQIPHPIAGHSTIQVNNYLISCFGIDANAKTTNGCNIFDISTDTFIQPEELNDPPIPRTLSSMASCENNKNVIYIFGGMDANGNGLNDLYKLDVSKGPTLSWSSINAKTTNKTLIPSGRGAHNSLMIKETDLMMVWGGISKENQSIDPILYFFNITGNTWVDHDKTKPIQSSNSLSDHPSGHLTIIIGIICGMVMIFGFVGFFIIRKRRFSKRFKDIEINNDPYCQPRDQFGSDIDLINDFETKQVQQNNLDELESIPEPLTPPLAPISSSPPTKSEKESEPLDKLDNCQTNNSVTSTSTQKRMSFGKLESQNVQKNASSTSEILRMKRTHRRTSSVSLTSSELANISRAQNFAHHKSSLSASNITSSINRSSLGGNTQRRSSLRSSVLHPVSEKGTEIDYQTSFTFNQKSSHDSRTSVRSLQWVAFNSNMINDKEENRNTLHVRNLPFNQQKNYSTYHKSRHSSDSSDEDNEEYVVRGDYIDTFPAVKNKYNRNIFDHDEAAQLRKNVPQNSTSNNISVIPGREDIENLAEESTNENSDVNKNYTSSESGDIDKFAHESPSSSDIDRNQERSNSMKKSKRSSKRNSRVSFALKDEKIEFDETESSSSVSLARMSGRSSSSQSSTSSSAIIEEENDI
ncbi:912_t:CDS:1 [Funneliformis geosporum]|uniref:18538_t:CDS:1 n=1 Tax=Funneliformis geosporum TaxID=1117311 RepID=A0A9W4WR42_9GLOM|nr:912_t:CDS:1 [Funneliformis geosporum]CAI2172685.1 18538_t:CDS:1 [Funneliformis geosporum]